MSGVSYLVSARSDPAPLGRAAAVVGGGCDVLDRADLEADRAQGADRGLTARARALDEDVDLLHAVVHRPAAGRLGGHLRGERGRLARALEADGAGRGPRDHRAGGVGDRDDGVVERALDVRFALRDVLLLLAAHLGLGARLLATSGRHSVSPGSCCGSGSGVAAPAFTGPTGQPRSGRSTTSAGLLLAGHGALRTLAGAGVGLRPLTPHREVHPVAAALVAADLDLATDVGLDLTTEVALDLEVRLDLVAEPHELVVAQLVDSHVGAHTGGLEQLLSTGTADAVDVGECDLDALVARQVDTNKTCHGWRVSLRSPKVSVRAASRPQVSWVIGLRPLVRR